MKKSIKEFFNKLEKENSENYFLINRFYHNPTISLGGSGEDTIDKYYLFGDIKKLVYNSDFFDLLALIFESGSFDVDFINKLDFNLLRKIKFICYDSIIFLAGYEVYIEDLHDSDFLKFLKNEAPLGKFANKYNILELKQIIDHYNKYGWLYEIGINKKKIESIDLKKIRNMLCWINFELDIFYEKYILPVEEAKKILCIIVRENYKTDENTFLSIRKGEDKKSINALVCQNEFVEIVKKDLINRSLPKIVINNIINILELSVSLKTRTFDITYSEDTLQYYLAILSNERIDSFDHKSANEALNILYKKRDKISSQEKVPYLKLV